jgi:chromosome segregation ATPase
MLNIKKKLECKYCNEIYKQPITLVCCGNVICKQHVQELLSKSSSNKFTCPLCYQENTNQNFNVNTLLQELLEIELHEFKLNPKYVKTLNNLEVDIKNLESILKEPQSYIYEEINELKRKVDLNREELKSQIDKLADGFIEQLKSYETRFKSEYESNVDFDYYNNLVESSKKQLAEYEKCLNLFSVEIEKRDEKYQESEALIGTIQPKIKELKEQLFSNVSIKYQHTEVNIENVFGKLIIQVSFI